MILFLGNMEQIRHAILRHVCLTLWREVSYEYFTLVVAPAGFTATGGGSSGEASYPLGTPGLPCGNSSGGGSSKPLGYYNPVTGVTSANPDGTGTCDCRTDTTQTVNAASDGTDNTPTPTPATGGDDNGGNGGGGNT
jgi:hypothetical protein